MFQPLRPRLGTVFRGVRRLVRAVRHVPAMLADGTLVAVLLLLAVYEYTHTLDDGHRAGPLWLNVPLTVLELVPLAWRRRNPVGSFCVGYAAVIIPSLIRAHTLFAYSGYFPLALYLYTVARHCPARVSRWALLGPPLAAIAYSLHVPQVRDTSDAIFALIVFPLSWLLGAAFHRQALQKAALADALAELARQQEQRERLAVLAERTRLARDLHDVVAHAVALILIQAGVARVSLDDDPDATRQALLALEQIGREATDDLRRLLGLLRTDGDGLDSLDPVTGVAGLPGLLDQMRAAGLDIEWVLAGDAARLSPSVGLTAFRIVQESLTNVLKHAGPTTVLVRLTCGDPVRVEVIDSGPRSGREPIAGGGNGLIGVRERVALFGGTVRADQQDRGFAVRAEIPQHA